nr:D-glycero-beta-D-manno-heptose 1-phosphate adenylyltransferase [Bacteroidales bacterium]
NRIGISLELMESKILNLNSKDTKVLEDLRKGKTVVFTNGCFDILHPGHQHLLTAAKKLGDLLILGLNTDTSVRQLKGPTRPINNQEKRAMNLSKIDEVDFIILFAEETPEKLIHTIKPDILLKGGDYKVEEIVGYDFLQSYGGQVITIPTLEGYSTTNLIEKNKKS